MSASVAANDIWKLGWTTASGANTSTSSAATVSVRIVNVGRSSSTPIEHDRDHDERALGRDLGTGEHEVKRCHDESRKGRPFLDRRPVCEPRDQCEQRADDEKDHAGNDSHVVAGNRQDVSDAGNEHRVVNIGRNRIALSREQHRGDGAGIARHDRADTRVDRIAKSLHDGVGTGQQALLSGRRDDFNGAAHEA